MFVRLYRKRLRSIKSTVIFLVVLITSVLLVLFLGKLFLVPVLVPEYLDILAWAQKEYLNGYWDYRNTHKKITYLCDTYLADPIISRRAWGRGMMGEEQLMERAPGFNEDEVWFNMAEWVRNGEKEINELLNRHGSKEDFLSRSAEILGDLRRALGKRCFYPVSVFHLGGRRKHEQLVIGERISIGLIQVAFLNVCIHFAEGNYNAGLEWVDIFKDLALRFDRFSFNSTHPYYLANMISLIACWPGLPEPVLDNLDEMLVEASEEVMKISFAEHYKLSLLFVENYYLNKVRFWNKNVFAELFRDMKINFTMAPIVSFLKEFEPVLLGASWNDLEDAVYEGKGKLEYLRDRLRSEQERWQHRLRNVNFPFSGCVDEFALYMRNFRLGSVYSGRIRILLEKWRGKNGSYEMENEENVLNCFQEVEKEWLNEHLSIAIFPERYLILVHPISQRIISEKGDALTLSKIKPLMFCSVY